MTTKTDQCRAAFEEWYERYHGKLVKTKRCGENYNHIHADDQWGCWQAAWNADKWLPMSEVPTEVVFRCRDKNKPWVTFEAAIEWEDDGYESAIGRYKSLYNWTNDEPIDGDWHDHEWQPLPKPPTQEGE